MANDETRVFRESDTEKITIMVVDDVVANVRLLTEALTGDGCRVLSFTRGDLALRAAAKNAPDLILLDIMMPGMDGIEVCRRLKESPETRDVPVIFLTALNQPEMK